MELVGFELHFSMTFFFANFAQNNQKEKGRAIDKG